MQDLPDIETLARRNFGSQSEPRDFGRIEWVAREGSAAGSELAAAYAVFDAGKSNVEHTHPNAEELVYVLEGEIEHTLGDQRTTLRAGDILLVGRDMPHQLINTSAVPCKMLIVFSNPAREFIPTA